MKDIAINPSKFIITVVTLCIISMFHQTLLIYTHKAHTYSDRDEGVHLLHKTTSDTCKHKQTYIHKCN